MNKQNGHVISWLTHLADEAKQPETSLRRIVDIFQIIAQYSTRQ
jgi:hypothetical protein